MAKAVATRWRHELQRWY